MNDIVDTSQVQAMFSEFDARKRKATYRNATRTALNIIKKQTLKNLKSVINPKMIGKKDKWGNSFRTGVTTKVYKSGKSGVIHIMKNFKLKFFELGTDDRYRKSYNPKSFNPFRKSKGKKGYTGRIKSYHFFKKAQDSTESSVFSSIDNIISESIKKINNKYKGK